MGTLKKIASQLLAAIPRRSTAGKSVRKRLLCQRLEERMMLAIDIDLVPVGGAISEFNGTDSYIVPPGGQFEMEVQIRSDVRETLVGWQLQFNDTSRYLCASSFVNHADWIPLGMLDLCNGHSLTSGANFQGVELIPGTTYSLGTFDVLAPVDEGTHRLTVNGVPAAAEDLTGFSGFIGRIRISDYGDVTILVNHVDPQPIIARDDFYSTPIDSPITFDPTLNDDTDEETLVTLNEPQNGIAFINTEDTVTYIPNAGFVGTDSFNYVLDNAFSTDVATVTIEVGAPNEAPVANDDSVTTPSNVPIVIEVLENDTDPNDDDLTLVSVSAANGQIVVQDDQSLLYTPPLNFVGEDSFTYIVADGEFSTTATVVVEVIDSRVGIDIDFRPVNPDQMFEVGAGVNGEDILYADVGQEFVVEAYIRSLDISRVLIGWQLQYAMTEVLAHSFVNAPDWIQLGLLDTAAGETLVAGANFVGVFVEREPFLLGSFTVRTPEAGDYLLTTRDSVSTPPADRTGFTGVGVVPIFDFGDTILRVVASVDPNVIASDDASATLQDTPVTLDVLNNDIAFDGSELTVLSFTQPLNGATEFNPDETITYTPAPGFTGVDTFTYVAGDGNDSSTGTVTILVEFVPHPPPIAMDDSFVITGPTVLDLLANDWHPTGDFITLESVSEPAHGEVEISLLDQTVTYTPHPGFVGTESLTYLIADGFGNTDNATVTIQVTAPPPANESFTQIGDNLVFRGTEGRDRITVRSQADSSRIVIITDTDSYGPLTLGPNGVLEIFALGGNDDVRIAGYLDELVTVVDGGDGNDRLFGSGGNDTLIGGTGNDEVFGGDGLNWLDGGRGNDELRGGNDGSVLVGSSGNDRLLGGHGNDVLDGGQGNDELWGLLGDDVLLGREDNDVLLGGAGNDFVFGEGGNDVVKGDSGNDLLFGGEGRDVLNGGRGEDAVVGGQTDLMTELEARTQLSDLLLSWTATNTWGDRLDAVQFSPEDDAEADTLIGGSDADVFFSTNDDTPTDVTSEDLLA